jgi:hypothetical protein
MMVNRPQKGHKYKKASFMRTIEKYSDLTYQEYLKVISAHKKKKNYTLGLFRSILENTKLTVVEKIQVRDEALIIFAKSFNFLQVKDPKTYAALTMLGKVVTAGEDRALWKTIAHNQEKILHAKNLKHRNFGTYSKHLCGIETCKMNGMMVQQGGYACEYEMSLPHDSAKQNKGRNAKIAKTEQKHKRWKKQEEDI